jgi:hypothetical protein
MLAVLLALTRCPFTMMSLYDSKLGPSCCDPFLVPLVVCWSSTNLVQVFTRSCINGHIPHPNPSTRCIYLEYISCALITCLIFIFSTFCEKPADCDYDCYYVTTYIFGKEDATYYKTEISIYEVCSDLKKKEAQVLVGNSTALLSKFQN